MDTQLKVACLLLNITFFFIGLYLAIHCTFWPFKAFGVFWCIANAYNGIKLLNK
jgi:hypothetical protein